MKAFSPRQNLWVTTLVLEEGTIAQFSLSDTPAQRTKCSVDVGARPQMSLSCFPWHKPPVLRAEARAIGTLVSYHAQGRTFVSWVGEGNPHLLAALIQNFTSATCSWGQHEKCWCLVLPRKIGFHLGAGGSQNLVFSAVPVWVEFPSHWAGNGEG